MKSAKRYVFLIVGIIAFFGAMAFLPMQNNVAEAATPFTVAINPGHGPAKTGSGAGGAGGLKESIINEQLASKVCSSLRARGIKVVLTNYMTSLSDSTLYIIKNPPATGKQYEFANPAELLPAINTPWVFEPSLNERNDLCISLHHNAGGSRGAETFYSSTLGAGYNKNSTTVARSADMANMISRRFSEPGFHINNRGVFDRDNNSITKYSIVPSVLVEAGYIDNIDEYNKVTNGTNQQRTADRIADAVVEYKSKYKSYAPPKLNSFSTPSTPTYNPIFELDANVSNASSVKVAVWTVKGDQDDLKWYNMRGVGNENWELNIDTADFKYATDYYTIHLFGQDEDGSLKFLDAKNIYLNADDKAPTSTAVKGILKSANSPIFTAIADNVTDLSGVRGVRFAVWTEKNGQDDLHWYDGMDGGGTPNWMAEVNAKNHNDEAGKYIIHAYGTDRRGNDGLMGYSTIMVKHKDYTPPTAGGVDSSTKVCMGRYISLFADQVTDDMSGVDGVRVAVWSAENGQDDLKWYNMGMVDKGRNRWGVQVDLKNHKGSGTYYAHVYATDKAGNDGFVGNMDFTLNRETKPPTSTAVKGILKSANSPIFTAIADNVTDPSGVDGVRFAVWTEKNGQDDLRWYDGMDGGGTPNWMAEVNAKNHNDEAGKYIIHAYGTDEWGNDGLMGYSTIMVKHKDYTPPTAGSVDSSTKVCTGRYISLFADQVTDDMSGVDSVRVAVWSAENGQDDLKWYNMGMVDKGRNRWGVQVDLTNHKGSGTYYAHVYATDKAGNDGFVGNMDFTLNRETKPPTATAVKGILKSANSPIFTAIADNVTDPSGVRGVRFAVWTEKNGQDDLRWYDGMDGGGTPNWMAEVNAKNHNDEMGKYIIHAYGTDEWGNDGLMGYSTIMVKHKDVTPPTASGVRTSTTVCNSPELSIFADNVADDWSGAKSVRAAIWSNTDGQDDLQWYNLGIVDYPNNLTWGRLIHLTDFNTVGDYQIHFYGEDNAGNERMLGNTSVIVNEEALGGYKIMGTSGVSALQLVKYYNGVPGHYDWNLAEYGGMSIDQFCQSYIDICSAEGVKAEVAFAQMCLETKTLNYGNLVVRSQWNFAGLGATGNVVPPDVYNPKGVDQGIYFTTVENGIKSQIQHLKAYASEDSLVLPTAPEYNRFGYVTRGCAPTVEGLSGKWATGMDYGAKVVLKVKDILATNG